MSEESDQHAGHPRPGSEIEKDDVELSVGDRVVYHPVEGSMQTTRGHIEEILIEPDRIGGRTVKASEDEPRYLIKNDHTQKTTAYYKKAIEEKLRDE
ncbi:hypothetical protein BC832DRAFT_619301 [Gaertneriomyces semiglobifer]|nr:hypothetical protein BC832DRAFT_619301 [Gaertneriomyces semiglobifer]